MIKNDKFINPCELRVLIPNRYVYWKYWSKIQEKNTNEVKKTGKGSTGRWWREVVDGWFKDWEKGWTVLHSYTYILIETSWICKHGLSIPCNSFVEVSSSQAKFLLRVITVKKKITRIELHHSLLEIHSKLYFPDSIANHISFIHTCFRHFSWDASFII